MRTLVDQLLFVARPERRDVPLGEPVDLVALAHDVVADFAPMAISRGRELSLTPEATQLVVRGNTGALLCALVNLAGNAVCFGPAGGTVEVVVREPAGLLVVDHGQGIPRLTRSAFSNPSGVTAGAYRWTACFPGKTGDSCGLT